MICEQKETERGRWNNMKYGRLEQIKEFLHGGDYNPDQWLDRPEILKEDLRLMKQAGVNVVTLGVFSWSSYEPKEGVYQFEWLDSVMDQLYENGIYVILSTPSGAKPPWMAKKYPQTMRVREDRMRHLYSDRENQCNSSEIYREKVRIIDEKLAERYHDHPALIMWHISNEIYGTCHCDLCQENFRKWLKRKYGTIDELNRQYWSSFWSHRYTDWSELESPAAGIGEQAVHGLILDYKRFYSDLTVDFIEQEVKAIRKYSKDIPVTTNTFHHDCGVNLSDLAKAIDVASWDLYPRWHCARDKSTEWDCAVSASFDLDYCRSMKHKPFYLMESVPSVPSQFEVSKLKRPGMHLLSSVQAIASGSESVQYFQWRKGRGGYEKFHGAVLSHNGSGDTRVFRDVCEVGKTLKEWSEIKGAVTESKVAVIYDWENFSALSGQVSLKNKKKNFRMMVHEYYEALLKQYVSVDIISQKDDFSKYQLIVAPNLYLFQNDTPEKIRRFVEAGGSVVLSVYSGLVNENDLAYEGYPPFGLNDVFGIRSEEVDSICDDEYNTITYHGKRYQVSDYCDLLLENGAEYMAVYERDFYKGMAAVTRHEYGKGMAYYVAGHMEKAFLEKFFKEVIQKINIPKIISSPYVSDVMVKERMKNKVRYLFLMNFSTEKRTVYYQGREISLDGYGWNIIREDGREE